jgi:hypothetical protein
MTICFLFFFVICFVQGEEYLIMIYLYFIILVSSSPSNTWFLYLFIFPLFQLEKHLHEITFQFAVSHLCFLVFQFSLLYNLDFIYKLRKRILEKTACGFEWVFMKIRLDF